MKVRSTAVLVVGAGPAGLVAAAVLGSYGVPTLVIERRTTHSTLPRATGISTRTMEILRSWGLEEAVRAGAVDLRAYGWRSHSLASADGVEIDLGYPDADEAAAVSPTRPAWAPQDHLEPVLRDHLAIHPSVELRMGTELVGIEQGDAGVRALLRDTASGEQRLVDASYVVAADGMRSPVREQLGIRAHGPAYVAHVEAVTFRAPLGAVTSRRPYGLNVITNPEAEGFMLPVGRGDRWIFGRPRLPGVPHLDDLGGPGLHDLLAEATCVPGLRPRVERIAEVIYGAQIAERFRERRVFLAGDAAHRMTPRGGTGMNTAIHGAHNLGWKLAWVLLGWASSRLLDSYEPERRPPAEHNARRSAAADGGFSGVDEALARDLGGRVRHAWVRSGERRVSTLDLVGDGLTLLTGPDASGWEEAASGLRLPVTIHALGRDAATVLDIPSAGALLVRPDALPAGRPSKPSALRPALERAQLAGAPPFGAEARPPEAGHAHRRQHGRSRPRRRSSAPA